MSEDGAKAAVWVAPRQIELRPLELTPLIEGQVRLRLEGCGVCGSNLPVWQGRDWFTYPQEPGAPGHEGWGEIAEVHPSVTDWQVGDRVAAITYHAYATHDVAAASDLVALPPVDRVPIFPAEPLGCAVNAFRRSRIEAGQQVAVIGAGFFGLLLVQLAVAAGARVLAASHRASSLELAKAQGAEVAVSLENYDDVRSTLGAWTEGQGASRVIECTGHEGPLQLSGELTAVRGMLIVAGYHQDGLRQINFQEWNWKGIDVINAHERDPQVYVEGMRAAVVAVEAGDLRPDALITDRFPLADLDQALERMDRRPDGFLKAVVLNPPRPCAPPPTDRCASS